MVIDLKIQDEYQMSKYSLLIIGPYLIGRMRLLLWGHEVLWEEWGPDATRVLWKRVMFPLSRKSTYLDVHVDKLFGDYV